MSIEKGQNHHLRVSTSLCLCGETYARQAGFACPDVIAGRWTQLQGVVSDLCCCSPPCLSQPKSCVLTTSFMDLPGPRGWHTLPGHTQPFREPHSFGAQVEIRDLQNSSDYSHRNTSCLKWLKIKLLCSWVSP